jgi:hypothetical protein
VLSAVSESADSAGAGVIAASVSLIPLGKHALRGIASPCAVFTVPEM